MKQIWISVGVLLAFITQSKAQSEARKHVEEGSEFDKNDSLQLLDWLKTQSFDHKKLGKDRYIYTWTSQEQIDEIRNGGPVLSRSEASDGSKCYFDSITDLYPCSNKNAWFHIDREIHDKKRFGWTNLWSTSMGYQGEKYGNKLMRIKLKPNSYIAHIKTQNGQTYVNFTDLEGKYISYSKLDSDHGQLAGAFFTHVDIETEMRQEKGPKYKRMGTMRMVKARGSQKRNYNYKQTVTNTPYREFILFSEAAIDTCETDQKVLKSDIQHTLGELGVMKEYAKKYSVEIDAELNDQIIYTYYKHHKTGAPKTGRYKRSFEFLTAEIFRNAKMNYYYGNQGDGLANETFDKTIFDEYLRSVCFSDEAYAPTESSIVRMIDTLKGRIED